MHRKEILETGLKLTTGDRNKSYGEPIDNFRNIATLWNAYLRRKYTLATPLTLEDVAMLNLLQKVARTFIGEPSDDTYIDAAVYAAIAGELHEKFSLPTDKDMMNQTTVSGIS